MGIPASALVRRPGALSGGQLQRLSLLRALALDPAVIVLDEPTSGLDAGSARACLEAVSTWSSEKGRAFVLVSHELEVVAERCDQVVVMDGGRVVEAGPPGLVFRRAHAPVTRRLVSAARRTRRELGPLQRTPED